MKRLVAFFLSLMLLVSMLPGGVEAKKEEEPMDKHQLAMKEARRSYTRSLRTARKTSFSGYCGMLASHQLWHIGVNSWCASYNGKDQYDAYFDREVTSGGYYIRPYSGNEYGIEDALNAVSQNGTKDVYNILVGFQRTQSQAGRKYGHACVINAILDGTVYLVESSRTGFGPEGQVIHCSIEKFAEYYNRSMTFEGIIHFGETYADICSIEGTDLFLQARFESVLRSQPAVVGQKDCTRLRSVSAGERLHATAILTDPQGERYYQVQDGEQLCYIAAGAVGVLQAKGDSLAVRDVALPQSLTTGEDMRLTGKVAGETAQVCAVEAAVTDAQGNIVLRERLETQGKTVDISGLNEDLAFDLLPEGGYLVTLYADAACPAIGSQGITVSYARQTLWSQSLQVGSAGQEVVEVDAQPADKDGWFYEDGTWFCYEKGKPCTGWVNWCGTRYYLLDSGAVSVGWTEVEGQEYFFSDTGALCTGWMTLGEETVYRREDGTLVAGWLSLDGGRYYFDESGYLVTGTEMTDGDTVYVLGVDGKAEVKVETEEE